MSANPERGEGLVTGDVVNTAARIESAAPVNGIAVGEQTYRTTSHVFEYEPLATVTVKGKAEPLALWRAKAERVRYGTDFVEHVSPFVGRELEKPLLIGVFERAFQQRSTQLAVHAGEHAGAATLYAEASARWQEFGNVPERAHALLVQGRCLLALARPGAERPLREARDLFESMGYKPALAESEALLDQTAAAPAA